jgi:hypothetical protein
MNYYKNIFNCLHFRFNNNKIHNENDHENNDETDENKIEQNELSIIYKNIKELLIIYKNIKFHLEFIEYILNTKISLSINLNVINTYIIKEYLTDSEYIKLDHSIKCINNNYKYLNYLNKDPNNNKPLIGLYNKITEYENCPLNLKKINALHIIIQNYQNIQKCLYHNINIINKLI